MPIFGQVGLFSLAAFAFGVLFTWLALARPLRRRVDELEDEAARQPSAVMRPPATTTSYYDPPSYAGQNYSPPPHSAPPHSAPPQSAPPHGTPPHGTPAYGTALMTQNAIPDVATEEPPPELPRRQYPSFFDGPDHPPFSTQDAQYEDEMEEERPVTPDVGVAAVDSNLDDQDAAYFAYLEESHGQDEQNAAPTPDAHESLLAGQEQDDEEVGSPGWATLARGDERPTEVFQPVNQPAEPEPAAEFAQSEFAQSEVPQSEVSQSEVAQFEVAESVPDDGGLVSGQISQPLPLPEAPLESHEAPSRSLFEPVQQAPGPYEEYRSYEEPEPEPAEQTVTVEPVVAPTDYPPLEYAQVPTGPFGPGSALPQADGSAPSPDFVVKARTSSMVFHTTSSPFYDRLLPQVWFRSSEDAMRAGFTSWERPEGSWGTR